MAERLTATEEAAEELFDALSPWIRRGLRELLAAHPGLYLVLRSRMLRSTLRVDEGDEQRADDVTRARARALLRQHGGGRA